MIDMRDLVATYLGEPARTTTSWSWWSCPLHSDTNPSFGVQDEHAHCFSCGFHAGPRKFLVEVMGWSLEQAQSMVGPEQPVRRRASVEYPLPPQPPPKEWRDIFNPFVHLAEEKLMEDEGTPGRHELLRRGISVEVWTRYRVGYRPHWESVGDTWLASGIVLPCYVEGKLWSVNVRTFGWTLKYHRPKGGASIVPFGLDQLQGHDTLILVEGEFDALAAATAVGYTADVIALRGTGNALDGWLDWFWSYDRVIVALDADDAGDLASEAILTQHPLWVRKRPPEGMDICDMVGASSLQDFLLGGSL